MSKWTGDFREVSRRPRLPALAGVRIFAALHIYFFHVKQAHDSGLLSFSAISALPAPLASLVGRGHVSTGLFFQLSGFLLAYAYLDSSGRPKTTDWTFWRGRFVRLYPLYFLSLLLLVPAPALLPFTAKHSTTAEVASGVLSSLTLTQAWFPAFALWWNAPAWALSAFAAFYAIFPAFSRWTAGLGQRGLMGLVIALTLLSWVPAGAYMLLNPADDGWTATSITLGGPWLMALRFNPLSWLPQFLAGVALGRMFGMRVDRGKIEPGRRAGLWPSAGDALARRDSLLVGLRATGSLRAAATRTARSILARGDQRPRPRPRAARTFSVVAGIRQTLGGELLALRAANAGRRLVLRGHAVVRDRNNRAPRRDDRLDAWPGCDLVGTCATSHDRAVEAR